MGAKALSVAKAMIGAKAPFCLTTPTEVDEYISDEEIFESHNALQTITLSLRKANKEFRDLVAAGLTTNEEFQRIGELHVKVENYGVSHVI